MAARSPIFDNVDPRLVQLVQKVLETYGPYGGRVTSGYRPPGGKQGRYHPLGQALDVELFNRDTNAALANYQSPETFQAYQQFANAVYGAADPELQKLLRWGGYFSGGGDKYGALDLMHFDLGNQETGMGGGSWAGGLKPEQADIWGLQTGGGIDPNTSAYAQRAAATYRPEQRRAAIAAIESGGIADPYGALGAWTGGPDEKDRAYGKYQVMGKNIPEWTKRVLGRMMTPDEFLRDAKAQDTVFDTIFGEYVQKYGEKGAAEAWFGGPGAVGKPDRQDIHGTTIEGYGTRYMKGLDANWKAGSGPEASGVTTPGGTGAPAVGAPAATKDAEGGFKAGDAFKQLGQALTGAGGSAKLPTTPLSKPTVTMTQSTPAYTLDPDALAMQRQKLAEAMARLNSGKLWV